IWDKLFGTFQEELTATAYAPIEYGLTKNLENHSPFHLVFHEWKAIWHDCRQKGLSFRQRCRYLFGPPGWSHDGSRMTSRQLLAEENRSKQETGSIL
ncbi:MAG TPA: hypothetical protein VG842_05930, partial [Sediminibacterium sp.]|nr:hypothetical protein [Sediminibacterium sp.]